MTAEEHGEQAGEERSDERAAARPVTLVEPVRQQLITLAADVLGRLAGEDVPPGLRAIARFAPAKRQRLGAVALATALDGDDAFRGHVADAVVATSPDLVAAVREGRPTAATDPVDVALVAYLTRPDGWEEVVGHATERWRLERAPGPGSDEELTRLRAEVSDLRAQARGESARTRDAVAAAAGAAEEELTSLRRQFRDRTRDLRRAERELGEMRGTVADAAGEQERRDATHEAELTRLRLRIADLERTAGAARRDARIERDLDDARLWLLVDTLVAAANGVRRELSLAPPSRRPGDTVESAEAAGGGRAVTDPGALDRVLAMPNVHLIIDGYNVTKTGYGELALAEQRTRLVGSLAPLVAQSGAEVTVAFDGGAKPPVQPPAPRGVRVLFSAADEIADDLIRRLVAAEPSGRPLVVVTSDRQVVLDTARHGAWNVPSAVLLARLG